MLASTIKQLKIALAERERLALTVGDRSLAAELELCIDQLQSALIDLVALNNQIIEIANKSEQIGLRNVKRQYPSIAHLLDNPELARI